MSAKPKVSAEQLKRRQAFDRLKRSLRQPAVPSQPSAITVEPQQPAPETPPTPAEPPQPPTHTPAPAHHGTAFAVREPLPCEVCRRPTTKWLSYKPEAKTCVCWNCGMQRQEQIMRGKETASGTKQ